MTIPFCGCAHGSVGLSADWLGWAAGAMLGVPGSIPDRVVTVT